jgi:hypothetical protein
MDRDIEVAENVLTTLIKQEFDQQRMFFPLEVDGSYQEGFGVTFRLPPDFTTPLGISFSSGGDNNVVVLDGNAVNGGVWSFIPREREDRTTLEIDEEIKLKEKSKEKIRRIDLDSARRVYNEKLITAAKNFIIDYSDLISQLGATERIMITNQGEQPRVWMNRYFTSTPRTRLSIDATKSDIQQYKQGKLTRDQMLSKVNVLNTETEETPEPDLELLSSIFSRLYRSDLSKTYFTDEGLYYERLKKFGAVYYMKVYSSNQQDIRVYSMPTIAASDLSQEERDKKVKELYPKFEQELKENMVEYGRTLKSLADDEMLVFNVKLTRCEGCGIPSSLEVAVKASVLREYSSGKITKDNAVSRVTVKKGQSQ